VLLVEDSGVHALRAEISLTEAAGAELSIVPRPTLRRAMREVEAGNIACVVLDLGLPDASGLDALRRIQDADATLPVVVLSGEESEALAVQAVQEGAQDFVLKTSATGPALLRSIHYACERKRREVELNRRAFCDRLTGLQNRERFVDRLARGLAREERAGNLIGVMFVDMDHFKQVNDTMGHDAGDTLLIEVAQRLSEAVRPSDAVARFGGDEFLILCDGLEHEDQALHIAERVGHALAKPVTIDGREVLPDASIGIAFGRDRSTPPELLIRQADEAMYRAKRARCRYATADALYASPAQSQAARRIAR
jgi:diguanylate cyclase (GGDEF)-like protein